MYPDEVGKPRQNVGEFKVASYVKKTGTVTSNEDVRGKRMWDEDKPLPLSRTFSHSASIELEEPKPKRVKASEVQAVEPDRKRIRLPPGTRLAEKNPHYVQSSSPTKGRTASEGNPAAPDTPTQ